MTGPGVGHHAPKPTRGRTRERGVIGGMIAVHDTIVFTILEFARTTRLPAVRPPARSAPSVRVRGLRLRSSASPMRSRASNEDVRIATARQSAHAVHRHHEAPRPNRRAASEPMTPRNEAAVYIRISCEWLISNGERAQAAPATSPIVRPAASRPSL